VLVVQMLGAAGTQAIAAVPQGGSSATSNSSDLSPEAAASQKAAASGSPVEVSEETTPTQLVTAQPDGTFTAEFDPEPVPAKQASGWVPVDTDLEVTSSGQLAPKAAAADIAFSGGGAHAPLARIARDGKTYSVSSPWTLPAPTLSGSTATYMNVMPGTDLVVQATPDGFSEFLRGTPGVYAREESHPRGCGAERRSIAASARPRSGRVSSPAEPGGANAWPGGSLGVMNSPERVVVSRTGAYDR
jgi:hypothetical protein